MWRKGNPADQTTQVMRIIRKQQWVCVLVLLWCAGAAGPAAIVAAESIPSAPLRVGMSGDYVPFTIREEDGTWRGFDVKVARAYASDRGRPVEFVQFKWPELQSRLLRGDFDVAMSGVTVRGDRLAQASMTSSVARTDAVLVIRAGTGAIVRDWTALVVGVNRGGHLEQLARTKLPRATIVPVDDNLSLPNLLTVGQVDGIVIDALEVPPQFQVAQVLSQDRKAYWVSPKASGLLDDLDAWIEARENDGSLDRWREEYFGKRRASELDQRLLRVVDLVGRRLMLMPVVALAKQAGGRAIEDPIREEVVEKAAMRTARDAGLDEAAYLNLVRVQFVAAKAVQKATGMAGFTHTGRNVEEAQRELNQVLRPAIDRIDRALLGELSRLPSVEASVENVTAALRADAPVPGLDDDLLGRMAEALLRLAGRSRR